MTVFVWDETPTEQDTANSDRFQTEWMRPTPHCPLCEKPFMRGQRVLGFKTASTAILMHADCVKRHARGLMKDIAECLR